MPVPAKVPLEATTAIALAGEEKSPGQRILQDAPFWSFITSGQLAMPVSGHDSLLEFTL
jgi:hypothetical protein